MTDKIKGKFMEIPEGCAITLVPFPNGGWVVRAEYLSDMVYPDDFGAFTTPEEMLSALHDVLTKAKKG